MRYRRRHHLGSLLPLWIRIPLALIVFLPMLTLQCVAAYNYQSFSHESARYEDQVEEEGIHEATFPAHHLNGAYYPDEGATTETRPAPPEEGVGTMAFVLAGGAFGTVLVGMIGLGAVLGVFSSSSDEEEPVPSSEW